MRTVAVSATCKRVTSRAEENLFRRNAIRALRAPRDGRPIAFVPKPWPWLALFCTCAVAVAFALAWHTQYARKETARGWLVSERGVVRIMHPTSARVGDVLRQAGDAVREGDVIAYLSVEQFLEDGSRPLQAIVDLLHEELDEVEQRRRLARKRFDTETRSVTLQLSDLDAELGTLETQELEQRARVDRSREKLERLASAARRGAIAEVDLLRQQDDFAAMQQALSRLAQERVRLVRERRALLARRERLATDLELRLSELGSLRNELRERITRNESERVQAVHAPVAGTIATFDLVAGSTIRPQQLLATIVPEESSLVADVYVPSRAVGLIERGQSVQLRYDAFPHERFGVAQGRVESIAEYVLLPADVPPTFGLREASYRVRVSIDSEYVSSEQGRHALKPGMLLAADIVLESRSLIDWLLARFGLRLG